MANKTDGTSIFFSLRLVGEINPLDIQAMAVSTELGESLEYSLEEFGYGISEYRSNFLFDAVHCVLTGGSGNLLSPSHSYSFKALEVLVWEVGKQKRIFKKVDIPSELLEQIHSEIYGKKISADEFQREYGSLFSSDRIIDGTLKLID